MVSQDLYNLHNDMIKNLNVLLESTIKLHEKFYIPVNNLGDGINKETLYESLAIIEEEIAEVKQHLILNETLDSSEVTEKVAHEMVDVLVTSISLIYRYWGETLKGQLNNVVKKNDDKWARTHMLLNGKITRKTKLESYKLSI